MNALQCYVICRFPVSLDNNRKKVAHCYGCKPKFQKKCALNCDRKSFYVLYCIASSFLASRVYFRITSCNQATELFLIFPLNKRRVAKRCRVQLISLTKHSNINTLLSRSSHFLSIVLSTITLHIPAQFAYLLLRLFHFRS